MGIILETILVHPNSNNSILIKLPSKTAGGNSSKKSHLPLGGNLCAPVWWFAGLYK